MTVACKLWLLAVVCVAFLYQDGPQGNGVSCTGKTDKSDLDTPSGATSFDQDNGVQDDDDDNQDSDNQSGSSSGGGSDSQGGGARNDHNVSSVEQDDDGDDDDTVSNYDKFKDVKKSKTKHETHKKSGKGKNHHPGDHDDDDVEDDDDGDTEAYNDGDDEDVLVCSTTTIKGKPNDIMRYLNAGVKPYKPAVLDFNKKSNSKLLKQIERITRSGKSSKSKKEPKDDLTNYIRNIIKESSKKKSSKQVDPDKVLITLAKTVLLQLLKRI